MKEFFRGRQYIHLRGIVWLKWWCKQTFECAVEFDTRRYHFFAVYHLSFWGLPSGSVGKQSTCNAGDAGNVGLTPGSVGSSRGGHDNPLQYSCLENPMDRGTWWATVHGVTELDTIEEIACMHNCFPLRDTSNYISFFKISTAFWYEVTSCLKMEQVFMHHHKLF